MHPGDPHAVLKVASIAQPPSLHTTGSLPCREQILNAQLLRSPHAFVVLPLCFWCLRDRHSSAETLRALVPCVASSACCTAFCPCLLLSEALSKHPPLQP